MAEGCGKIDTKLHRVISNIASIFSYTGQKVQHRFFLLVLVWLIAALGSLTREERKKVVLSYDNMCHLDNLRVAKKPLPLPGDLMFLWLDIKEIIDTLHIHNHKIQSAISYTILIS